MSRQQRVDCENIDLCRVARVTQIYQANSPPWDGQLENPFGHSNFPEEFVQSGKV